MPRSYTAAALAVVAVFGLTACEKQSPIVTMTADGVVVKAHAIEYCRPGETGAECNSSKDVPILTVHSGDTLGIDVPRSVADHGWMVAREDTLPPGQNGPYSNDHYRAIPVSLPGDVEPGSHIDLYIHRNPEHGKGLWHFKLRVQ